MFIPSLPHSSIEFHCHRGVTELRHCSDFDKCIEDSIKTHFKEDEMVSCNLHCLAKPYMWDIVCEDWQKNVTNCPKNDTNIDITVFMNMSHIIMEEGRNERCLFLRVQSNHAQVNGKDVILNCPKDANYFNTTCDLDCGDKYLADQLNANPSIENSDVITLYQFWLFFAFLISSWIGMAVVVSIGDAICFSLLNERHHLYGNQRLWGAVGFGVFSIITGVLVDKISGDSVTKNYTIVFWMTALILSFDVYASTKLNVNNL